LVRAILSGHVSGDEADRWAARWITADDPGIQDPAVLDALTQFFGINLTDGPGQPYLHNVEQIAGGYVDLRAAP